MGLGMGMALPGWIRAEDAVQSENRRQEAFKMKAYMNGFQSEDGIHYNPDERGKLTAELQLEKLQQQVAVANTQNQIVSSYLNTNDMTRATSAIINGKAQDADAIIKHNPILREQLKNNFGVTGIQPIDLDHDANKLKDLVPNLNIVNMTPEQRQALQTQFVKTINTDGSTSIIPTEAIVRETGYTNYLTPSEAEQKKQALKESLDVLRGAIKSPEEEKLYNAQVGAATNQAELTNQISGLKLKDLQDYMNTHPDATLQDYLKDIVTKTPLSPKEQLDIANKQADLELKKQKVKASALETNLDLQSKKLDIQNKKLKNKSILLKMKDGTVTQPVDIADFYTKLDNLKFDNSNLQAAKHIQGKATIPTTLRQQISGKITLSKTFASLTNELANAAQTGKIGRGAMSQIQKIWARIAGGKYTPGDTEKLLNTVAFDTKLKASMAAYVKLMSGAAVSDEERKMYSNIITQGDWSKIDTAFTALNSFNEYLQNSTLRTIDSIKTMTPYDYMLLKHDYNTWVSKIPKFNPINMFTKKNNSTINPSNFDIGTTNVEGNNVTNPNQVPNITKKKIDPSQFDGSK